MAERNPEVMEMVAQELDRDGKVSVEALFEKAREIDSSIDELSLRQFHARYPLPLKRARSKGKRDAGARKGKPSKPGRSRSPSPQVKGSSRDEVRRIFLDFAGELARAESRAAIVDVLARVDEFVDRALQHSRSGAPAEAR